jgi:ABC-type multidrug transport system fused ATPase/permease subunit
VLFNETVMYNIAYGAVRDPSIKGLIDDPASAEALIERITPASKKAQIHDFILKKLK